MVSKKYYFKILSKTVRKITVIKQLISEITTIFFIFIPDFQYFVMTTETPANPNFLNVFKVISSAKKGFLRKKVNRARRENVARGMAGQLDLSMDSMEETRFKKRNQYLIQRLEKRLHFTYAEIECLLLIYYKLWKEGLVNNPSQEGVTKVQFRDVLHCALDMTDDSLMDRVFLALDKGPSSCISMETWATAFSLFLRGTIEEKIQFCFSIYDIMGDGILARDSIFQLLRTSLVSQSGEEDAEESAREGVTKVQFRDVLHCALDMTDDSLMDRVFLALDKGPSSCISMETWATAFSLFLRGTIEEKIQFCFSIYDIMGDGILARDSIFQLLRTSLVSQSGEEDAEESARDMIEVITKKMDIDRDGKISYADYKQSVLKNPMLLEAFGQCLPSRQAIFSYLTTFTSTGSTM
ncbi:hypothetical protein HUJ04_011387 [Dendroctonus ponderosae]|nr:hypothetical protein HUJ04_011387 [Dendroctonus ponderosae]